MSMSFKRNEVQEFIETALTCFDVEKWGSYKGKLEQWRVKLSDVNKLKQCIKSDINSYFIKALQSFSQALCDIENKRYTWSIVKLYYCIFYLLRCEVLLSNHILIRCKSLYYVKVSDGESPVSFNPKGLYGDHQLTIALVEKLYKLAILSDPMLGNKIDGMNVYLWMLKQRERVNYQMKDFADPQCDSILNHIVPYYDDCDLLSLFKFYNSQDCSICFDTDHTILAVPYKKLVSIYNQIKSDIPKDLIIHRKIVHSISLLGTLGMTKENIKELIVRTV